MPSADVILEGLETIGQRYALVAIAWRLAIVAVLVAAAAGWRPSRRVAAGLMVAPLACVALLALVSHQPFNAIVFAILAVALLGVGLPLTGPVQTAPGRWPVTAGAAMIAFAWAYPHFLAASGRLAPFYAAPTGLVPCSTLALVIGFSLLLGGLGCAAWSGILSAAGLFYGVFGVGVLGVRLDGILVLGALALGAQALLRWSGRAPSPPPARGGNDRGRAGGWDRGGSGERRLPGGSGLGLRHRSRKGCALRGPARSIRAHAPRGGATPAGTRVAVWLRRNERPSRS